MEGEELYESGDPHVNVEISNSDNRSPVLNVTSPRLDIQVQDSQTFVQNAEMATPTSPISDVTLPLLVNPSELANNSSTPNESFRGFTNGSPSEINLSMEPCYGGQDPVNFRNDMLMQLMNMMKEQSDSINRLANRTTCQFSAMEKQISTWKEHISDQVSSLSNKVENYKANCEQNTQNVHDAISKKLENQSAVISQRLHTLEKHSDAVGSKIESLQDSWDFKMKENSQDMLDKWESVSNKLDNCKHSCEEGRRTLTTDIEAIGSLSQNTELAIDDLKGRLISCGEKVQTVQNNNKKLDEKVEVLAKEMTGLQNRHTTLHNHTEDNKRFTKQLTQQVEVLDIKIKDISFEVHSINHKIESQDHKFVQIEDQIKNAQEKNSFGGLAKVTVNTLEKFEIVKFSDNGNIHPVSFLESFEAYRIFGLYCGKGLIDFEGEGSRDIIPLKNLLMEKRIGSIKASFATNGTGDVKESSFRKKLVEFCVSAMQYGKAEREEIKVLKGVDHEQKRKLMDIIEEFNEVFTNRPGLIKGYICHFTVNSDKHFFIKPYPVPIAKRKLVDEEINGMIQWGVIERSNRPYNNPLVIVTKADKSVRLVQDARNLNKVLRTERDHPQPIDVILQSL